MAMEVRAATEALRFLSENRCRKSRKAFSTLTGSTLSVKANSNLSHGFFCPGHSGVQGNERADKLAGDAVTGHKLTFDSPLVLSTVRDYLQLTRKETSSHKMKTLQEKKIKAGAGCQNMLRGVARRQHNQLLVETISMATLRSSLKMRG